MSLRLLVGVIFAAGSVLAGENRESRSEKREAVSENRESRSENREATAAPVVSAVVDGAAYDSGLAPGGIVSIFGTGLAAVTASASALPLPSSINGTTVDITYGGRILAAPLYFVSPNQINAQLPYEVGGFAELRVRNSGGLSMAVQITPTAAAPKFFSANYDGQDRPIAVHADWTLVANDSPAQPGETLVLYLNALGAVTPAVAAGDNPGANPLHPAAVTPSVLVNSMAGRIQYAGLAPGLPGVYQVNVLTPYDNVVGDVAVAAASGQAVSQSALYLRVQANGFNWLIPAGRQVNGQVQYGATESSGSLAFRQHDLEAWGETGYQAWTRNIYGPELDGLFGLALTLRNNGSIVYDNNGIESGNTGTFYNNTGGVANDVVPGLFEMFSMSNNVPGVAAGVFRLTQRTTITEMTGYFDGNGQEDLRFNPANVYNTFRMNIWSDQGGQPRETGNFTGDVFSTDNWKGTFSYSSTGVQRIFHDGASDEIYRIVYHLATPLTLEPGDYWFSEDVATPDLPVSSAKGLRLAGLDVPRPPSKFSNAR